MDTTTKKLIAKMEAKGYRLTEAMLSQWARRKLLPPATRVGKGRGKPPRAVYQPHIVERIETICRMRKEDKGLVEIEKYLIKEHLGRLLLFLEEHSLQDTETYKRLRKWQGLRWEALGRIAGFDSRQSPDRTEAEDYHFISKTYNETPAQIGKRVVLLEYDTVMREMNNNFIRKNTLKTILDEVQQQDLTREAVEKARRTLERKHSELEQRLSGVLAKLH
ncbi:MAG: hypothetical protein NOU37_08160 [Candidatus Brocadiales bacterium]|nr:hypothetical protein [Candidatus Bathyanammoxibius amoris]